MLALAQYWNLLAGYAGLVSIGQQAFIGLGAYALFAATLIGDLDPLIAIVIGGVVAAAARAADRARRVPAARRLFRHRHLGGGGGLSPDPRAGEAARRRHRHVARPRHHQPDGRPRHGSASFFGVRISGARDIANYWLALALLVGTLALVFFLLRSRRGLALAAIRDSETAADSLGVDGFRTKLVVYVLTAFGTGMIGALIYLQKARISPDAAFSVLDWTAYVIFIVVIGGIGTIEGPIIGAIVLYLLQDYLAPFGAWYLMLLGGLAIARHAGRARRDLGLRRAALRPADLSGAAAAEGAKRLGFGVLGCSRRRPVPAFLTPLPLPCDDLRARQD